MAADLRTTKQPKKQRGRRGQRTQQTRARVGDEQELDELERAMALTSFISFCDTRPAEEEAKKRRRPRSKTTKTAANTETEKKKQTTKQSDHQDPAECQGYYQKKSPPMPAAEQSAPGHPTLDAAPEDNATTTTTAELSTSTSPLASLVSLSLV